MAISIYQSKSQNLGLSHQLRYIAISNNTSNSSTYCFCIFCICCCFFFYFVILCVLSSFVFCFFVHICIFSFFFEYYRLMLMMPMRLLLMLMLLDAALIPSPLNDIYSGTHFILLITLNDLQRSCWHTYECARNIARIFCIFHVSCVYSI